MKRTLTYLLGGPRSPTLILLTALSVPALAGEVLFVSDSETDAVNIPAVLSTEHNVTVVLNDYLVEGGTFGAAEGTNPTLKGDLSGYCAVFWSASGPHEPLGLSPDRMANGSFENFAATFVDTGAADGYMVLGSGDTRLPGWTVNMPVAWGITPTDGFTASEGDGFIDLSSLGDTSFGDISQDVATTDGTDYVLSIDRQGDGSIVSLNGVDVALTAGATNGSWTTYTANFTAGPGATTTLRIRKEGAGTVVFVDNISIVPQPPAPLGLGADGGLHTDPAVFSNLVSYVEDGGFVFVTGHDAIAHPFDPLLADFVGGAGSGSGQGYFPAHSSVFGNPTAITIGNQPIVGFVPVGGGVNPVDGVPEQDFLVPGAGGFTPLVSLGPGFAWTVRHPFGPADDFFNGGHIAYVANGIFFYETEQEDDTMTPFTETLSDGQDPSWLAAGGAYRAALLNFAENGCKSPTIDDLSGRGKGTKVNLVWTDNGADSYDVFRSDTSGGPYAFLGSTTNNVYVDSPVVPGNTYYYVVQAVFGGVNADNSNEAEVTVPAGRRR